MSDERQRNQGPPSAKSPGRLARRANLSAALTLLHRHGSLSRAELTRLTGLNRSTTGAIVAELVRLGLATEGASADTGTVGRPSPVVRPNDRIVALTANPDIDAVTVGAVGLGGVVHARARHATSGIAGIPDPGRAVQIISEAAARLRAELDPSIRVVGVGLAVPGLVHRPSGTVTYAPHLEWRNAPLAAEVSAAVGLPCQVANDAFAATVAEGYFGSGRGLGHFLYANGSASGIGGGAVLAGSPLEGAHGYAGELGHMVVNPAGRPCHCGRIGCLETEVTRSQLLAALGVGDESAEELDELLAASTSPAVAAEVDRQLRWLAAALVDAIHLLNPEAVVLGGFLGSLLRARPVELPGLVAAAGFATISGGVRIEAAWLGVDVATVGAAQLVFEPLLADPARALQLAG